MRTAVLLLFLFGLQACFLFRDYKKKNFAYTQNGQVQNAALLVPKGYVKEDVKDTAGIHLHSFRYPGGSVLYAAYLADTTFELQAFDRTRHQPRVLGDGLVFKGQDSTELFYREIRKGNLRFGYRSVPALNETYFDSATNYAVLQNRSSGQ